METMKVAVKSFEEVIRLYADHAFAHYYLAKSLENLGKKAESVKIHKDRFNEIVNKDEKWKEYADFFNLL